MSILRSIYYTLRPAIPRSLQVGIHKYHNILKRKSYEAIWPIDETAGASPDDWQGWPEGKRFALILTHDVELLSGQEKCPVVANIEKELSLCSSFNFVPERYIKSEEVHQYLKENGFEIGVHGLIHDGKLYASKEIFKQRAIKINKYLKDWGAVGFRSPAMHHNLDWIHYLDIEYDLSTFDTDPFEPQPDGVKTIFPFWVNGKDDKGYIELPYTIPQDSTLFIFMNEKNINIWKKKVDWIVKKGGMVLINTHPDYMNFSGIKLKQEEYPAVYYKELLEYIVSNYNNQFWNVLPKELARYMKSSQKKLIKVEDI